jgi:hypothetical protein
MYCLNNVPAESLKKLPELRTVMTESAAGVTHLGPRHFKEENTP